MDVFEKELRSLFPGPNNEDLRRQIRERRDNPTAIRGLAGRIALTGKGAGALAAIAEVADALQSAPTES